MTSIAELIIMHQKIADRLNTNFPNQNDFRFASFGAMIEIGEAMQHLPWRPWRAADFRSPTTAELEQAIPEYADAISAIFRAIANLGIDPYQFEEACLAHIQCKYDRLGQGIDR